MEEYKIKKLEELNDQCNGGRGSTTLSNIIQFLKDGKLGAAKTEYYHDADKLFLYYDVRKYLEDEIFGCRLHFRFNCSSRFCSRSKETREV